MKTSTLTTLSITLLLLTTSVAAQETSESTAPNDLTVLEKSWRKVVIDSQADPNPLRPNEDYMRQTHAQKVFIKERDNALPNQPTEPRMPAAGSKPVTPARGIFDFYLYTIKVKNTGAKKIKNIYWEYQFLDPDTQQTMEQRKLASRLNLSPGKSRVVQHRLTRKPTVVVNADQLDRKYRDQFTERIVINRIVYSDGSVWRRTQD